MISFICTKLLYLLFYGLRFATYRFEFTSRPTEQWIRSNICLAELRFISPAGSARLTQVVPNLLAALYCILSVSLL
jgi:hypothetical protein